MLDQPGLFTRKSQCEEILAWLKLGHAITPLEALQRFGCFRLGGRIYDLKQAGHNIVKDTETRGGKRFASYRLVTEQDALNSTEHD